jgi:hypothetical protein
MIHTYTDTQIIQLIYKELDLFTRLEMEFAMEEDSTLLQSYDQLLEAKQILPDVHFSPKTSSIDKLLQYSRQAVA